jgi:hypothetical protein
MKSIYQFIKSFQQARHYAIALLMLSGAAMKAQVVTVGSNQNSSSTYPLEAYYGYNYSQTIYLASDIMTAGGAGPANITSVSFYYTNVGLPVNTWDNWTLYMKNTTTSDFIDMDAWETGLTQVYTGTITPPATSGQWMTITLTTPFLWDGSSNIVVGLDENTPGYTNSNTQAYWGNTIGTTNRTLLFRDDNTNPDPLLPPTATSIDQSFADVQFDLIPTTPCTGNPIAGTAVSSSTVVCLNTPYTLNVTGGTVASGLTYQWQSSPTGTIWSNVGTAQGTRLHTVPGQTATTLYRCIITCTSSAGSATTTAVTVNQNSLVNCFCSPQYMQSDVGYIFSDISFSNIQNLTPTPSLPGTDSYQDLTGSAPTISVTAGQTYSISSTSSPNGAYTIGMWIDYNNSGVFDNWEYSLLDNATSGAGTYTTNVTIPFYATGGNVKMRLKLEDSYGTNQDPCINYGPGNGEVLDFLVHMTALANCTGTITAGNATSTNTMVCSNVPYTLNLTGTSGASGLTFQWQSSPNGTAWTNLGSVQPYVPYTVSSQPSTRYYRCVVTCTGSATTATSTPVTVNQTSFLLCYCNPNPNGGSCGSTFFTDILFNTINTSSIICNGTGYEDLTATTTTVTANQTYTLSTSIESYQDATYATAWIDFDHNGSYDPSELINVGSASLQTNMTFTTAVTIPFTAMGGLTTMRIKTESNNSGIQSIDPCMDQESYGHTIDYSIFINAAAGCSGTPVAGTAVSSSTIVCSESPFTLNLTGNSQVSGGSYQWQYSLNNSTWVNLGGAQSYVPYTVNDQTVATYYRCVVTCVGSGLSQNSASVLVGQNAVTACYCIPPAQDCSNSDEINLVVMGSVLTNSSTCAFTGYTDYTSSVTTATITAGLSYPMDVTVGSDYDENVSVWIDYDHNGSFDATEYTYIGSPGGSGNYVASGNISVPSSVTPGLTRMRVRSLYYDVLNANDACLSPQGSGARLILSNSHGETEDYSVYILPANCGGTNLPPNMTVSASTPTVCPNAAVTLSITTTIPNYTGYTYQWQYSPTGTGYSNIGSPVANPSITVNPTDNNYYICQILCNGSWAVTTSSVFVAVNGPTLTVTAGSYSVCPEEPVTFSVTGAVSYVWAHNGATTATTTATPTLSTTYSVTGTGSNGCSSTGTVSIFVKIATGITGTITTGASVPVAGTAILYKYEPFFTKFDSVTSQAIAANGGYNFTAVNYGIYIVKAVPTATNLQVTYGTNSVNWKTATLINHDCATPDVQNIDVVALTTLSVGPGSLSGQIREGQGFGQRPGSALSPLTPGQPIGGIVVKGGKNPGGSMFAQTITDGTGTYSLTGLPNNSGTEYYFILVDIPGLDTNSTYRRVISTGNNTYTNLDFIVDSARINPVMDVSVKNLESADNRIMVYPNPAKEKVSVFYTLTSTSNVSIQLYDIVGKLVKTALPTVSQGTGEHAQHIGLSELSAGMYFVKLRINDAETSVKVFVTD